MSVNETQMGPEKEHEPYLKVKLKFMVKEKLKLQKN